MTVRRGVSQLNSAKLLESLAKPAFWLDNRTTTLEAITCARNAARDCSVWIAVSRALVPFTPGAGAPALTPVPGHPKYSGDAPYIPAHVTLIWPTAGIYLLPLLNAPQGQRVPCLHRRCLKNPGRPRTHARVRHVSHSRDWPNGDKSFSFACGCPGHTVMVKTSASLQVVASIKARRGKAK